MDLEQAATEKIRIMRGILIVGFLLTIGKFIAWFLTHSDAVLTDALESIINIIAAAIGLFSLTVAARPRDENHPYGHGKIEFLSVGFEGGAIFLAGAVMAVKAVYGFFHPLPLARIDIGLWITAGAAESTGSWVGYCCSRVSDCIHKHWWPTETPVVRYLVIGHPVDRV